jgi:Flp pilus assembly protein TadD
LLGITVLFVMLRQRHPFLLTGWLWFAGMLVPVIGLVQVGRQSMADRYTYLPSFGVMILVVWGVYEIVKRWRYHEVILALMGMAAVVVCSMVTRQQLGYWQDSGTLFRHTLEVTRDNYFAHKAYGTFLLSRGQNNDAISQFQAAIRLRPDDAESFNNLGIALRNENQTGEAENQFQNAVRFDPDNAEARHNLGNVLLDQGKTDEAILQFRETISLKPDDATARNNLGIALAAKGQLDEAIRQFQEVLRLQPGDTETRTNLAHALELKRTPAGR